MQRRGETPSPTDRSRKRNWLITLGCVLVLVFLPLGTAAGFGLWFSHSFGTRVSTIGGQVFPDSPRPAAGATGSHNILLIGSDTRATLGDVISGTSTGQRSDTMMLIHVPADGETLQVMSLMRDLWVPIPGHSEAKLNAAFSYGGIPLSVATIENLLGARIDHVAVLDFAGFADMSTAVGGVEVESPKAFTSHNLPGYSFEAGTNVVSGQRALAFVRERYAFADADYQRVRDQQSFMRGLLSKAFDADGFAGIATLNKLASVAAEYVAVDDGLTFQTAVSLALQCKEVRMGDVQFFTLPTLGTGTEGSQSIVIPNTPVIEEIGRAIATDGLADYLAVSPPQARP